MIFVDLPGYPRMLMHMHGSPRTPTDDDVYQWISIWTSMGNCAMYGLCCMDNMFLYCWYCICRVLQMYGVCVVCTRCTNIVWTVHTACIACIVNTTHSVHIVCIAQIYDTCTRLQLVHNSMTAIRTYNFLCLRVVLGVLGIPRIFGVLRLLWISECLDCSVDFECLKCSELPK